MQRRRTVRVDQVDPRASTQQQLDYERLRADRRVHERRAELIVDSVQPSPIAHEPQHTAKVGILVLVVLAPFARVDHQKRGVPLHPLRVIRVARLHRLLK
eukprot:1944974-Prymnesium_polylepis.2